MEATIGRHRGTVVAGTAFSIALLFLASVIGVLTVQPDSTPLDRSLAAVANAPVDTTPIQPPIDLAPLVSPAPAGFDRTTPEIDGAVTIDQLVVGRKNIEGAKSLFTQLGLQSGFIRTWQRTGGPEILAVRLYQFGRVSGARTYFDLGVDARSTPDSTRFEVPGVPDAIGIDAGVEDGHRLGFIYAPKGRIVVVIAGIFADPPDLEAARALARSQVVLLP